MIRKEAQGANPHGFSPFGYLVGEIEATIPQPTAGSKLR